MNTYTFQEAIAGRTARDARVLLTAYGNYVYRDLGLLAGKQRFYTDLAHFPGTRFTWPEGAFYVAYQDGIAVGCAGLARLDEANCEMKRLFVLPVHRGKGVGSFLCDVLLEKARELGYRNLLLDTNREMKEALALYRRKGFRKIAPYCENENPNPLYFQHAL
ncbi:MAG: GNAT family N-acetyltransferase [Hymenobacteraceae bacterium]|nr:GNAT family N-acetyltransferase [Hymenobacteraceae bacterium]